MRVWPGQAVIEERCDKRIGDVGADAGAVEDEVEGTLFPLRMLDASPDSGTDEAACSDTKHARLHRMTKLRLDLRRKPMPRDIPVRPQMSKELPLLIHIERLPHTLRIFPHSEDEVHGGRC